MKKIYKKPKIYEISIESECMIPIVLSNQSVGGNVDPIGGEGDISDEADAKAYNYSSWNEDLWNEEEF